MTFSLTPSPPPEDDFVQLIYPLKKGEKLKGATAAACSRHRLGIANLLRQSKSEIDWGCFPPCLTLRCRDAWLIAYATICGPEEIINQLINDIINCVEVGVAAAGLSAIFAGPAAALPAFEAAFKGCLASKVDQRIDEISVSLTVEEETSNWGPC